MRILHLKIDGRIPSKKNNRRNFGRTSLPSLKHEQWKLTAGAQLLEHKGLNLSRVEIQLEFWMPDNRKTDLDNKVSSIFDLLDDLDIIEDDCWQVIGHYSVQANGINRKNPRVELWIKEMIM